MAQKKWSVEEKLEIILTALRRDHLAVADFC